MPAGAECEGGLEGGGAGKEKLEGMQEVKGVCRSPEVRGRSREGVQAAMMDAGG